MSQMTTDRVIIGMCHQLNSQLAAANAYVFLLRRRELLGDFDTPLQEQLDRLADSIRLIRSICARDGTRIGPTSLAQLAETATQLMTDYPDGPVSFVARPADEGNVFSADWSEALRAFLVAGAWVAREVEEPVEVTVSLGESRGVAMVSLAPASELPAPSNEDPDAEAFAGLQLRLRGSAPRAVEILLPQ